MAERYLNHCNWPGEYLSNTTTGGHKLKLPLGDSDKKYIYLGWVWDGKDATKSVGTAAVCKAAQWYLLTKELWDTPKVSMVLVVTWHQKGQKVVYSPLSALYLFCGLQVSEWSISRIVFWERNPLHFLSHGDFTQTDIKTGKVYYFKYKKPRENKS